MANDFYDQGRLSFVGEGAHSAIDAGADNFRIILLDTADHTTNLATDIDHADLTGAGIVGTSANLASHTGSVASNLLTVDSADYTFTSQSGDQFEEVVYYKWSGVSATSPLIANYDTGTGLPFTPSGGDITVAPASTGWYRF